MSTGSKAGKTVLVAFLWIAIIGGLGAAYKFLIHPRLKGELAEETGSSSQYRHTVRLAADSFSGYAVLRSSAVRNRLRSQGIRLIVKDDKADYLARLEALKNGDVDMAVYTVDSYIKAGAVKGDYPASIVMVIDETKGADAVVCYKQAVSGISALDSPEARFVLTPNSPSEFLARVVIATFSLPSLPQKWWVEADGAGQVYQEFKKDRGNKKKRCYVMWEPYVSKALTEAGSYVLLGSDKISGYIVDVLVANRKFLKDNPDQVKAVVESYQRAAYGYRAESGGLTNLVMADAKATGSESLDEATAAKLVGGIQWKNTLDNYAHFGLAKAQGVKHLEDVITDVTKVLIDTGALKSNPVAGKESTLFYDGIMRGLKQANFHPAKRTTIVKGAGPGETDLAAAQGNEEVPGLTDDQWNSLQVVGSMRIEPISFLRGGADITERGQAALDGIAKKLVNWPTYYLKVVGHARAEGDPQANRQLAAARAQSVANRLVSQGVSANRLKALTAEPNQAGGEGQSVSFVLGQTRY